MCILYSSCYYSTVFPQIAKKAGISEQHVEFAKGIGAFPCDVSPLEIQEDLDWDPKITSINAWPLSLYDDGGVLYYRYVTCKRWYVIMLVIDYYGILS